MIWLNKNLAQLSKLVLLMKRHRMAKGNSIKKIVVEDRISCSSNKGERKVVSRVIAMIAKIKNKYQGYTCNYCKKKNHIAETFGSN